MMNMPVPAPPATRVLVKFWLPVIVWMLLIFIGSTDLLSSAHSSRIIGPILRWFNPDISPATIRQVQMAVRKTGHLAEYAILAWLMWRARRQNKAGPWAWSEAGLVLLLIVLYALTDEAHQAFVASRYSSAADILLDGAGGMLGLAAQWCAGRWRKRW